MLLKYWKEFLFFPFLLMLRKKWCFECCCSCVGFQQIFALKTTFLIYRNPGVLFYLSAESSLGFLLFYFLPFFIRREQ